VVYFIVEKTVEIVALCIVNPMVPVVDLQRAAPACVSMFDTRPSVTMLAFGLLPATFLFNLILMLLTIYNPHTAHQRKAGMKVPVLEVLKRGGAAYFGIYLSLSLTSIVLSRNEFQS